MKQEIVLIILLLPTVVTTNVSWVTGEPPKSLYQKESIYQTLTVFQEGSVHRLYGGRMSFSAIDMRKPYHHVMEYTEMMIMGMAYVESPKDILMIGLGGGTIATYLRKYYPDLNITIVELDNAVLECSQKFFDFKTDENMEVVIQGGRWYLMKNKNKHDVIFLDAYHGDYIPFHLLTKEFLILVKDHLKQDGIVVSNTWSNQKLYERESATYADVFGHFDSYLGKRSGNRIIISSKNGKKFDESSLYQSMANKQDQIQFQEVYLPELFEKTYDRDLTWPEQTQILTDDYAPVNTLIDWQ